MTLLLLVNLGFGGGGAAAGYSFTGDLTTQFRAYVDALHDTALVASDSNTLVEKDVDDMIAATAAELDRNTRYKAYLS